MNNSRPTLTLKLKTPAPQNNVVRSNGASEHDATPLIEPVPVEHFWFCWRVGSCRPKKRHASLEVATAELQRLRGLDPAARFIVFEARAVTP